MHRLVFSFQMRLYFIMCISLIAGQFNERIVREIRPLSTLLFDEIMINGAFDVFLSQAKPGNSSSTVEIETTIDAQQNVIVNIVDNHILSIHVKGPLKLESNIYLYIRFHSPLRRYTVEGTGNIMTDDDGIENYSTEKFVFDHRGSSNVAMRLNVTDFEFHLIGTGNIRFSGEVRRQASFYTKGVGDVHALNLRSRKVNVLAAGVNLVRIQAVDDVEIEVTGASHVFYQLPFGIQPTKAISTGLGRIQRIA
jgi:hypothetical protein